MTTWTVPDSKFVHLMFAVMFTSTRISISSGRRPTKLQKAKGLKGFHLSASNQRNPAKPAAPRDKAPKPSFGACAAPGLCYR